MKVVETSQSESVTDKHLKNELIFYESRESSHKKKKEGLIQPTSLSYQQDSQSKANNSYLEDIKGIFSDDDKNKGGNNKGLLKNGGRKVPVLTEGSPVKNVTFSLPTQDNDERLCI